MVQLLLTWPRNSISGKLLVSLSLVSILGFSCVQLIRLTAPSRKESLYLQIEHSTPSHVPSGGQKLESKGSSFIVRQLRTSWGPEIPGWPSPLRWAMAGAHETGGTALPGMFSFGVTQKQFDLESDKGIPS